MSNHLKGGMGYRILRFTNEQVLFDTDNVISVVKQNLMNIKKNKTIQ